MICCNAVLLQYACFCDTLVTTGTLIGSRPFEVVSTAARQNRSQPAVQLYPTSSTTHTHQLNISNRIVLGTPSSNRTAAHACVPLQCCRRRCQAADITNTTTTTPTYVHAVVRRCAWTQQRSRQAPASSPPSTHHPPSQLSQAMQATSSCRCAAHAKPDAAGTTHSLCQT